MPLDWVMLVVLELVVLEVLEAGELKVETEDLNKSGEHLNV